MRRQAEIVLDYYLGEIHALGAELSLSRFPDHDQRGAEARWRPADDQVSVHQEDEPYRRALVTCYARMAATRAALAGRGPDPRPRASRRKPYATPEEFAADLDVIAASLAENGDADLARRPAD